MHGIKKAKNMKTIEKRIYYQWWNIESKENENYRKENILSMVEYLERWYI